MKTNFRLFVGLLSLVSLGSCSEDVLESGQGGNANEYVNKITVTVQDIDQKEAATRALTIDEEKMKFAWTLGDIIGIYPLKDAESGVSMGEDQHAFPISDGAGTPTAFFDGGAWALRSNILYAAYYPFSADNYQVSSTAIPVSYLGQAQDGNATSTHLTPYDYLVASATQPSAKGGVNLELKRKGCVTELEVTMPIADTFTKVTVESNNTPFVTKGTIDLTAETPVITSTETSASISIDLTNVTTSANEQKLNIFFMSCPVDLSESELTITFDGTTNKKYIAKAAGKNLTANGWKYFPTRCSSGINAKGETITFGEVMDGDTHTYVDLGLPSGALWATCNVGAESAEQPGNYYAWGEVATKESYAWSNYSYYANNVLTKYSSNTEALAEEEQADDNIYLLATDDVAHSVWGSNWKVPSTVEMQELLDNCTWTWTSLSGTNGYKVSSKADGNTNWIFLPVTGSFGTSKSNTTYGYYWTNGIDLSANKKADYLKIGTSSKALNTDYRYFGMAVRPVCYPVAATSLTLSQSSMQVNVDCNKTLIPTLAPENITNSQIIWTSTNTDVITVSSEGKVTGIGEGTATVIATSVSGCGVSAKCAIQVVAHEYVDLGLSVKWATMNVGATEVAGSKINAHTGKLDCYGEYYAWGETTPKDTYNWSTLKYCSDSNGANFSKYVASGTYGVVDNKTTLELSDDAARANWEGTWRMPTWREIEELCTGCYWEYTTSYNNSGVTGYIVYKVKNASDKGKKKYSGSSTTTSASYSLNDTHIFLPMSGSRSDSTFSGIGFNVGYWTSSLHYEYSSFAYYLSLVTTKVEKIKCKRYAGHSVRAVCP